MTEIKCDKCDEVYDADNRLMVIRHQQSFCLSSGRRKKRKPSLSLKEQWIADRAKERARSERRKGGAGGE